MVPTMGPKIAVKNPVVMFVFQPAGRRVEEVTFPPFLRAFSGIYAPPVLVLYSWDSWAI